MGTGEDRTKEKEMKQKTLEYIVIRVSFQAKITEKWHDADDEHHS